MAETSRFLPLWTLPQHCKTAGLHEVEEARSKNLRSDSSRANKAWSLRSFRTSQLRNPGSFKRQHLLGEGLPFWEAARAR